MAYTWELYRFPGSIEHGFKWMGQYGSKVDKRSPRKKPTAEQIAKQNQRNKETKVRRLIKLNFTSGDYWATLKFPKGTRLPVDEVKKLFAKFIRSLKGKYERRGAVLKWIARMEIGTRGGIHIHIILPRLPDGTKLIQDSWKYGRVNFETLYEDGGYEKLAEYIVKPPKNEEEERQLSLFDITGQKKLRSYSCSRNLIQPIPEKRTYSHRTVRKLIENGPTPTKGYYIDKNSIRHGVNPYTGYSYLYYTEIKIKAPPEQKGEEDAESEYLHSKHDKRT